MKNYLRTGNPVPFVLLIATVLIALPAKSLSGQISVRNVNAIVVDNNNVKWFSTDAGIVSFDGSSWIHHQDKNGLPSQDLKSLAVHTNPKDTELWIASPGGATVAGLPIDDQTEAITYHPGNTPLISQDVLGIAAGKGDIRWIGTDKGVSALRNNKWLSPDYDGFYTERMFMEYPITSMATNPRGDSLYVGTEGVGVLRVFSDEVDGISGASVYAQWGPIDLPSDYILSIYVAPDGTKWFGTEEGVARHTGNMTLDNWTVFTSDNGLVDNFVQAICGDKYGNIWFGTLAGISVFTGSSWTSYTMDNGLVSNNILSLATDKNGTVWIGTDVGISSFENEKFISF